MWVCALRLFVDVHENGSMLMPTCPRRLKSTDETAPVGPGIQGGEQEKPISGLNTKFVHLVVNSALHSVLGIRSVTLSYPRGIFSKDLTSSGR